MSNLTYTSVDSYPVGATIPGLNEGLDVPASALPSTRIQDFLAAIVQQQSSPIPEALRRDLAAMTIQFAHLQMCVNLIAEGKYSSTDENPVYVGGVVSSGNRIFTPQEAAKMTLESVATFNK